MIQLRQVSRYVYDVFAGTGFDSWTRVRRQHWGVVCVAGNRLNKIECKQVEVAINQNPQGSVDPITI